MTIDVRTTPTLTTLIGWVRREVRDPSTEADGTTRPTAALAWTDSQIEEAITEAIVTLQIHLATRGDATYLRETTATVTDGEADFPAAVDGMVVESVRAQVGSEYVTIARGSHHNPTDEGLNEYPIFYRWSLKSQEGTGTSGVPSATIVITPKYSGTIQIRYWQPTEVPGAASDQHSMLALWGELVALFAARALLRVDDDFTAQQAADLQEKLELFHHFTRPRSKRVRRVPR